MFSGILDSIPGVGHVKGVKHYFAGDRLAARRSMYEATRSFAVIVGGAAGAIGGPAGMAAGAAAAGAATDAVTSFLVQNPQGIVAGIADIAEDISNGDNPLGSIAKTTLIVGTDIIGGAAGSTIGNCVTKAVTESTGKKIVIDITKNGVKQIVATRLVHGATRSAIASTEPPVGYRNHRCRSTSTSSSSSSSSQQSTQQSSKQTKQETSQNTNTGNSSGKESSSSNNSGGQQQGNNDGPDNNRNNQNDCNKNNSGGQQQGNNDGPDNNRNNQSDCNKNNSGGQQQGNNNDPDKNRNNQNECNNVPAERHWAKFFKIFGVKALDQIIIKGINIFEDINPWQKKELKDFITDVNNKHKHELSTIIKITEALISELEPNQVTAHNFVNIAKFVLAYLCQELEKEMELFCKSARNFTTDRDTVAKKISQADSTVTKVMNVFNALMNEITSLSSMLNPKFVNAIAAVYHYFKHKFIKAKNRLFAPAEYFNLAREGLDRMKSLPQFEKLQKEGAKRIVYEKYYADVGRRLVIVIKKQIGCWNLASVYFEDVSRDGDKDGDEWINGEKIPRCF